jgi:hypothetical protein
MPHLGDFFFIFFEVELQMSKGRVSSSNAHSLSLRRGTGSDLLDTELGELGLQLLELLGKVFLALSPELTSLDLGCRLTFISITNPQRLPKKPEFKNCAFNIPWWAASCRVVRVLSTVRIEDGPGQFGMFVVGLGFFSVLVRSRCGWAKRARDCG